MEKTLVNIIISKNVTGGKTIGIYRVLSIIISVI